MPSSPFELLVILGATGNQGRAVLTYFSSLAIPNLKIRGITRNVSSTTSLVLASLPNVEMVEANINDLPSLKAAFQDATYLFANTDSGAMIQSLAKDPEMLSPGETPIEHAYRVELQQGQNILAAAADALATDGGLKRLVWSSLASPKKWSAGRYQAVRMWDAKEDIEEMLQRDPKVGRKVSVLVVGYFATNALHAPWLRPRKTTDGVYEFALPVSGDIVVPWADLDSDLGRWAKVLMYDLPARTTMMGSTSQHSWAQWAQLWGQVNGVPTRFRTTDPKELARANPGKGLAVAQMLSFVAEFGYLGGKKGVIWPDEVRAMGIHLEESSIEEHIRTYDWSPMFKDA